MQEKEINVSRENKRVRSRLTKIPYTPLYDLQGYHRQDWPRSQIQKPGYYNNNLLLISRKLT